MQKRLISLLCIYSLTGSATGNITSAVVNNKLNSSNPINNSSCNLIQQQAMANRQKIQQAFTNNDGCTIGNTTIQTHKLIQANLQCFPKYAKGEYNIFRVFDRIDTSIASSPASCDNSRAQVTINDQKVKQALIKEDGCTSGKLELQSFKIIQANLRCFPRAETSVSNMFKALDTIDANAPSSN